MAAGLFQAWKGLEDCWLGGGGLDGHCDTLDTCMSVYVSPALRRGVCCSHLGGISLFYPAANQESS